MTVQTSQKTTTQHCYCTAGVWHPASDAAPSEHAHAPRPQPLDSRALATNAIFPPALCSQDPACPRASAVSGRARAACRGGGGGGGERAHRHGKGPSASLFPGGRVGEGAHLALALVTAGGGRGPWSVQGHDGLDLWSLGHSILLHFYGLCSTLPPRHQPCGVVALCWASSRGPDSCWVAPALEAAGQRSLAEAIAGSLRAHAGFCCFWWQPRLFSSSCCRI